MKTLRDSIFIGQSMHNILLNASQKQPLRFFMPRPNTVCKFANYLTDKGYLAAIGHAKDPVDVSDFNMISELRHLNSHNFRITTQSFDPNFFAIISIKNLSIATKPRVKPLFCNIYERRNKTSLPMRCPTGARRRYFSLYFPTNESMCLLNAPVLNLAFRQ